MRRPVILVALTAMSVAFLLGGKDVLADSTDASLIAPIAVEASHTFHSYDVNSLINGSGMVGDQHDGNWKNMWMGDRFVAAVRLTFDLGGLFDLDSVFVWQYNAECCGFNPGIRDFTILASDDGINFDIVTEASLTIAAGGLIDAQETPLTISARYIRFDVHSNHGNVQYYGLSEVRFSLIPCFEIDAIDDPLSVINDGTTTDFLALENDECSDDEPISVVELPGDLLPDRGGSATTNGDTVSYTPAAGFVGFEEFTYTAQDAGLDGGDDPPAVDQDTATVVVDVLENFIPGVADDVATALQDQAIIIDVLENDSLGNAPNEVAIETEPANGSATVEADDTIRYSPNSDFFGEDSFEYRLTDANGDSDVATVTVGVFFVGGQVPIDIMPNSDGNNLNLRAGQGAGINIAILSVGEYFEAPNEIDPLTLKFGPREGNIWGSPQVRDVDGDGDEDLVVKFLIQQTGIPCGDTHAILSGRTFDFQSISGRDTINTFNCPRVRKRH